jgi:Cu+-exporting ATPase
MNKYMNSSGSSQQHEQHHGHTHRHAGPDSSSSSALTAGANPQWTCPMHPEILRDAPGDCPICGMALVPIAGTGLSGGEEAHDSELRDLAWRLEVGVALSIPLVWSRWRP